MEHSISLAQRQAEVASRLASGVVAIVLLVAALLALSPSVADAYLAPGPAVPGVGAEPASVQTADLNGDGRTDLVIPNTGSDNASCSAIALGGSPPRSVRRWPATVRQGRRTGGRGGRRSQPRLDPRPCTGQSRHGRRLRPARQRDRAIRARADFTRGNRRRRGRTGRDRQRGLRLRRRRRPRRRGRRLQHRRPDEKRRRRQFLHLHDHHGQRQSPQTLAAGYLDGDASLDLAVGFEMGTWQSSSTTGRAPCSPRPGRRSSPETIEPVSLFAEDLNADSIPDLVLTHMNDSEVTIFVGDGAGGFTFTSMPAFSAAPGRLRSAT